MSKWCMLSSADKKGVYGDEIRTSSRQEKKSVRIIAELLPQNFEIERGLGCFSNFESRNSQVPRPLPIRDLREFDMYVNYVTPTFGMYHPDVYISRWDH